MRLVRIEERPRQRWRNGEGWTRVLAQSPAAALPGGFAWRVSVANLDDECSFSDFPGVERRLVMLRGDAVTLTVDGCDHHVAPGGSVTFPGEARVTCTPHGTPAEVLNILTLRGVASARTTLARAPMSVVATAAAGGSELVVVALSSATLQNPPRTHLHRLEAVRLEGADKVEVGEGAVAVIELRTQGKGPRHRQQQPRR